MKLKVIFISFVLFSAFLGLSAHTTRTTVGACNDENKVTNWTATWVFDDNGRPLQAAGIDCDGNPWTRDLREDYRGIVSQSDSTRAWISTMNSKSLEVMGNNANLIFRIVDIQRGWWVHDEVLYTTPDKPLKIDISLLPRGQYGLVVIYNYCPIDMLNFVK